MLFFFFFFGGGMGEVTYLETKSEILQTSRLEIPHATELETMRSDLQTHSADLRAQAQRRGTIKRIEGRNHTETKSSLSAWVQGHHMLLAPDMSKPPEEKEKRRRRRRRKERKKRGSFSSSSFSLAWGFTWRQIKVPWLSGSGVGRVVSGSPLSPPQQSLPLSLSLSLSLPPPLSLFLSLSSFPPPLHKMLERRRRRRRRRANRWMMRGCWRMETSRVWSSLTQPGHPATNTEEARREDACPVVWMESGEYVMSKY